MSLLRATSIRAVRALRFFATENHGTTLPKSHPMLGKVAPFKYVSPQSSAASQQTHAPKTSWPWGKIALGGVASLMFGASFAQSDHSAVENKGAETPSAVAVVPSDVPMRERMTRMVRDTQAAITQAISEIDGTPFREDEWQRPGGGGGWSRVLQDGNVFEKAGVNVSVVYGTMAPAAVREMNSRGKNLDASGPLPFFAVGISLVIHPHNPMVPTVHCNYRYFETMDKEGKPVSWWFGGGADLTPSYLFEEDAVHFHRVHKEACDRADPTFYTRFKKWCDKYFVIEHRKESRGVGGIFFDDLDEKDPDTLFAFVKDCADAFLKAYIPIVLARKDLPFTPEQKIWQQVRRGRYVEFNLVYDRGTKFGLQSHGRIESILMSLPLTARWMYDHHPEPGSPEDKLLQVLKNPRDWVSVDDNNSTANATTESSQKSE
eukprot:TRINITY_DN1046_c0_g3_i1.p1 TRINITY_DN1046_c0_g3~~TRINITY_DN1046_c0_g3_i1.p1  ORF type:complete len:432 (+),score=88.67 TRINITY_DN1046_c0_g3_i1:44-1339(+)